ncbi:MAG: class I SAM-dependent methyltransferase [Candidatus Obscuribacterales bacterium]|nr:class I SAM-dependent methyltransferase [Candidatus Obscuribacterales bacterium]
MPSSNEGRISFAPELSLASEGFPDDAHDRLFPKEAGYFWFRARNQIILWALNKYFPQAKSFFELGCGNGLVLSAVGAKNPQMELYGADIYDRGLHFAAKRLPNVTLYQMDATKIPFEDHFDVIGAFDVLEHIKNDTGVLEQMRKAVRKGGGLIISVPQHEFLWSRFDEHACHVRRYSVSELTAKVEAAGFKVVRTTSFVTFLLPLMMAARLKEQNNPQKDFDPEAEFRIPGWLNKALEAVLAVERATITSGVSWPLGSSLLLIAQA